VRCSHVSCGCCIQAQTNHTTLLDRIGELSATVNAAEDSVFQAFCRKIKVSNIREYEERQMKVAQEESKARLQYETQISRLTHQFVFWISFLAVGGL
jgi:structural maintenance of chromosome 1